MEGPISSRNQDRHATPVDPSDVAPHYFVGKLICDGTALVSDDHHPSTVATTSPQICGFGMRSSLANADRIRRCWNGCIGIANPEAVPELVRACEALLPYVEDQVSRGQVPGEDTSHFGDARAVAAARAALAKAKGAGARSGTPKSSKDKISDIRETLAAGNVNRPAVPEGRDTHATDIEFTTDIASVGGEA